MMLYSCTHMATVGVKGLTRYADVLRCCMVSVFCDVCVQTAKEKTDWMSESSRRLVSYVEPTTWALASTAQTMTVWMTLLVTVDRYVAVCQPWRVADFPTHRRRTRLAVCLVLLAAVLYNVPRYFERQVLSPFLYSGVWNGKR